MLIPPPGPLVRASWSGTSVLGLDILAATAVPDQSLNLRHFTLDAASSQSRVCGHQRLGRDGPARFLHCRERTPAPAARSAYVAAVMRGRSAAARRFPRNSPRQHPRCPAVGLPAERAERPTEPAAFPAVHDMPPPRNSVMLTDTEPPARRRPGDSPRRPQSSTPAAPHRRSKVAAGAEVAPGLQPAPRSTRTAPKACYKPAFGPHSARNFS